MKNSIGIISALVAVSIASPVLADDAMDVSSMVEQSQTTSYQPITPSVQAFNIANLSTGKKADFMATMANQYRPDYRLHQPVANFDKDSNVGLVSLIVPKKFAFRSTAQDSGVDAVIPGRYVSHSVNRDYTSDTGPAARDKSTTGIKFDF